MLPENFRQYFSPLSGAWNEQGITAEFHEYQGIKIPGESYLKEIASGFNAIMIAGDARFAPRTVVAKPFIITDGTRIPVGWLPVRNAETLSRFISTASAVQKRKKKRITIGLLSQRNSRYLHVADKLEQELKLQSKEITSFRWTSELVFPEDMMAGINCGLGAVIYLGHGRPIGWSGYFGIRMNHFMDFSNEPAGSVIALCCHTANRRNVGISFSENLVMEGIAASAFGAVKATLYTDNTRWAVNVCQSLAKGITTIGELIADAAPINHSSVNSYRLIGDPLAPLFSSAESVKFAKKIKTYY